jgi:hypothetical protein
MPRRKKLTKAEVASMVASELTNAVGASTSESVRAAAQAYYDGLSPSQKSPGRSQYISTDVADMVEATVAASVPALLSECIVEARPRSGDDVEQARFETYAVHAVIVDQNAGGLELQAVMRDALLMRNGWVKVWHETREEVRERVFEGVTAEQVAQAKSAGMFADDAEIELEGDTATVVEREEVTRLRIAAADPARILWSAGWDRPTLDGIPFFAEHAVETVSDLIEAGYSRQIVEGLPDEQQTVPEQLRSGVVQSAPASNRAARRVEVHRCYYRYDSDGDGVAELHRIVLGGRSVVLEDEIVGFIPFAGGCAILRPHSLEGVSLFDRLAPVQDAKTKAVRQWLDNAEKANNARVAANARVVNADDLLEGRPWAPVLVNGPVEGNIREMAVVDVGPSMAGLVAYMDRARSERGGASLDLQAAEAQIAGETASGIERQYSVREQMAALFCSTLAQSLWRSLYELVHKALREWQRAPMTLQVGDEWQDVRPSEWGPRQFRTKKGLSLADRTRKRQALEAVIAKQEQLIAAGHGGVLTDARRYYSAVTDWCYAAGIDHPERYWIDPTSQAARRAAQANTAAAEQAQAEQNAGVAQALKIEAIKVAADARAKQAEIGFDYFKTVLESEVEMAKLIGGATLEVERLQIAGEQAAAAATSEAQTGHEGMAA